MKDIFPLVDSFGILSLLSSNKEKYKDHPVLKQIEELSTKPLYVVFNGEALVKCIQYKQPIPVDSIEAIANGIKNGAIVLESISIMDLE